MKIKRIPGGLVCPNLTISAIDLGCSTGITTSAIRVMFLDQSFVSLLYGHRVRAGLKPKRSISGCISGHSRPI